MSPYPFPSLSSSFTTATPTPTAASQTADATPKNDPRLRATIVVLVIVAAFLIAYIIYITVRLQRRQDQDGGQVHEPQGTVMQKDHIAAHIIPFGAVGPEVRGNVPQFKHRPGQDMRIALRRPDGAWHFTDSRTPFTPAGVSEIDVVPSPVSASVGFFPATSHLLLSREQEANASRFLHSHHQPPPPVYYREPCKEHFDDSQSAAH